MTLVGWGAHTRTLMSAAMLAEKELGVSCEVIDLRTLSPWDKDIIMNSVKKTGRLIVSHEAPITSGFGAEISTAIQESCFLHLEAPIKRVCGYDTPFPHMHEVLYYPDMYKVFEAIKETANY